MCKVRVRKVAVRGCVWAAVIVLVRTSPLYGQTIASGNYHLSFSPTQAGRYGIEITSSGGLTAPLSVDQPAQVLIKTASTDLNADEPSFASGYSSIKQNGDGSILAGAVVETTNGSRFALLDNYRAGTEPGTFIVARTVRVEVANRNDLGFNSRYTVGFARPVKLEDYHFFAPGIWYDDNSHVVRRAIASNHQDNYFYYRETRSGLPFIMMQDPAGGTTLSLAHILPNSSSGADETSPKWLVDPSIQYASLGAQKVPRVALALMYPACEGETNYLRSPNKWVRRSHPVQQGFSHSYTVEMSMGQFRTAPNGNADFHTAYAQTWRQFYRLFHPGIQHVPAQTVYRDGIDLFNTYSASRNEAWGWPFVALVPSGVIPPNKISYQMGFVGEQIPAAFQMLRYGLLHKNEEILKKGIATMDFWATRAATPSGLPLTWYNVNPPTFRDNDCTNPIFLRIVSDGMEGALDAANIMREHHQDKPSWDRFVRAYGDWLVRTQNPDGSFYRAFNPGGAMFQSRPGCNTKAFGESKFNTTHPIRFLVGLYFASGDKRYLHSALAAGKFSYENIYKPGLYVGGTADNPNTLDKEAGIQALHAFLALYDATHENSWLDAAVDAANFSETWMYAWTFAIRDSPPQYAYANTRGQSLIATGHSGTDIYLAFAAYDFYRLHLLRDDPSSHFLQVARFFAENTKLTTQLTNMPSQNFGFAHPGLVGEAVNLSNLRYIDSAGSHSWLPWLTIAEIEPLQKLQDVFGNMSIDEIEQLPLTTRQKRNGSIYRVLGTFAHESSK